MKKVFLSALAVAGIAAFISPAQAQIIVDSTTSGAAITGAASFANFNGSTSSIAGEVNFPSGGFAEDVNVLLAAPTGDPTTTDVLLIDLTVSTSTFTPPVAPAPTESFEAAAAAALINAAGDLNAEVSLIRAWTSGGLN